jgi:thymidylate synthase
MTTADEMWLQAIRDCINGQWVESRHENSMEVIGWCHKLDTCDYTFLMNRRRKLSMQYAMAELLWYLTGNRTIELIGAYAPQYAKFTNNGIAWGAYGYRWAHDPTFLHALGHSGHQLYAVIDLLSKKPTDRRAVVTMWNAGDLALSLNVPMNDMPCTLTWQFLRRKDHLHMVCTMRSEDVWLGMPYDIFVNTCIQRLIADALHIKPGSYTHQVGSLHIYQSSLQKAHEALHEPRTMQFSHAWDYFTNWSLDEHAATAISLERLIREYGLMYYYETMTSLHPVLHDAVLICASKWIDIEAQKIKSRALREEYLRRQK